MMMVALQGKLSTKLTMMNIEDRQAKTTKLLLSGFIALTSLPPPWRRTLLVVTILLLLHQ